MPDQRRQNLARNVPREVIPITGRQAGDVQPGPAPEPDGEDEQTAAIVAADPQGTKRAGSPAGRGRWNLLRVLWYIVRGR